MKLENEEYDIMRRQVEYLVCAVGLLTHKLNCNRSEALILAGQMLIARAGEAPTGCL